MKKAFILFFGVLLLVAMGIFFWNSRNGYRVFPGPSESEKRPVTSFRDCIDEGYPIMESYPRMCRTTDGTIFTEYIGNELEKTDLIRISKPRPNGIVKNPMFIQGEARGYWFFEASFPAELYDDTGILLGTGIMQTQGEWMTEGFVRFLGILQFSEPSTPFGTLILKKDNPSGLPEYDDELRIPIQFSEGIRR